jgi:hypothetical protein
MEPIDPALRSAIARAVGLSAEALARTPDGPLRDGWTRAYGRPAMTALHEVAQFLEATPPARPTLSVLIAGPGQPTSVTPTHVIQLQCPHPGACHGTAAWNPHGGPRGRYEPRRPAPSIVRQVVGTLVGALGRAVSPTEVCLGVRAAVFCSSATAHRALRSAVRQGVVRADRWNKITVPVGPPPSESIPPGGVSR